MASLNSDAYGKPAYLPKTGELGVQWGLLTIATAQSKSDTVNWFEIPAKSVVLGGELRGADIDTGTETYEHDIGIVGNTTKYLDSGVLTGDAVAFGNSIAGIAVRICPVLWLGGGTPADATGYTELSAKEDIIGTITAVAHAGGVGKLSLWLQYTRQRT